MLAAMKSEIVKEVTENFSKYTQTLDLKIKCSEAKRITLEAKAQAIENEQYSRKSNIKIYGMEENKNENSKKVVFDMCKKDLKLEIHEKDIDAAHRVGVNDSTIRDERH